MPSDSKFTRDDDGNVAVRVVSNTGVSEQPESMFTTDEDGNVAVRVVFGEGGGGGGGSDQHNLGWYATQSALEEAHPTAEAGDWAIVGSTDTVWIWDTDTSAWKDSDQKGQVTSVNNQTGAVTLDINDIAPTQTGKSGYVLGTDGFVAGWVKPEIVQRSALPQASEEEVDNIYEYVGTTDANYTNGYFYKCVSDGQQPAIYSWTQVNVQPAPVIPDPLPSQTGNAGKFLTTNGTDASWGDALVNRSTVSSSTIIVNSNWSGMTNRTNSVCIDNYAPNMLPNNSVVIGYKTTNGAGSGGSNDVIIGYKAHGGGYSIAIGNEANASNSSIQIGKGTNSEMGTLCVSLWNDSAQVLNNYKLLDADGTIPTARLTKVNTTITLASANWSSNSQTVNVTGMTATGVVFVSPDPTDQADYTSAGIICSAQAAGTLTFTCDSTPANDIDVNVVML